MRIAATILILTAAAALASPWQMVIARKKANAGGGEAEPGVGDVLWAAVRPDGWTLDIALGGMATGGVYDVQLGTYNAVTGAVAVTLSLTSEGYDDSGVLGTKARTVYGTHAMRKPYPAVSTKADRSDGTNVIITLALSEPIYTDDASISATILSGLYVAGGVTSAAASAVIVTNNSGATYTNAQCIANWSMPPKQLITSTSVNLRVVAFQAFAEQGRPVRAVKFRVADESGVAITNIVTAPSVESDEYGDLGAPIIEYIGEMNLSTLTAGDTITCDFWAYPWVGDAQAVRTSSGGPSQPTPLASSITMVYDPSYERRVAVVDSAAGNDATGVTVSLGSFDSGSPPAAYATINGAAADLESDMTRGDLGGCIIYLRDNAAHSWVGGSTAMSARDCWVEIATFPTDTQASITTDVGNDHLGENQPTKLSGVLIQPASSAFFNTIDWFWMDACEFNATAGLTLWRNCDLLIFTACEFVQVNPDLGPWSSETTQVALLRGSEFGSAFNDGIIRPYVMVGNRHPSIASSSATFVDGDTATSSGLAPWNNYIIAYNEIRQTDGAALVLSPDNTVFAIHGAAIVQNLLERTSSSGAAPSVSTPAETGRDITNMLWWHNTWAGWKSNMFYNDTYAPFYRFASFANNIDHNLNIKTDRFSEDGTHTNNWMAVFAVHGSGNLWAERPNTGAPGETVLDFEGISSRQGNEAEIDPLYLDDQSISVSGSGNGDYTPTNISPVVSLPIRWLLPFDLAGNVRTNGADAAGAYVP